MNKKRVIKLFKNYVDKLNQSDIALDCGANVGNFTSIIAESGATVYAFEPNPYAYEILEKRTAGIKNVNAINVALATKPGKVRLYLHEKTQENPVLYSTGSSILDFKSNVLKEKYIEVDAITLTDFIRKIGKRISLLKMDVEGAEIDILNEIIDEELHEIINYAFIELHDKKNPELIAPTKKLCKRIKNMGIKQFNLNWH